MCPPERADEDLSNAPIFGENGDRTRADHADSGKISSIFPSPRTFSRFFLVNNNNVADISFIKSDIVSEVDNIYIGYFQYNNNGIISYSTSSVDGKYNSINKRDVFGVNFYSPEQPIIDLNRIKLHDVTFYLMREGYEENISKIRNSQNKEIFTVIFKVMDDTSFSGEILYINKGIDDRGNFKEFPVYKNLNITSNGKITNWNE